MSGVFVWIDLDRYGGAYSGARFTAWAGVPPDALDAGDSLCQDFWEAFDAQSAVVCGRGNTAQTAFLDLKQRYPWAPIWQVVFVPFTGALLVNSPEYEDWIRRQ
jgi:hypothetical protein